jgi:NAD+ synthetase
MSVIAKNFFPKKYLILLLPCIDNYQNDKNYQDSLELVKLFNLNYKILNFKKLYDFYLDFFKNLNFDNLNLSKITKGNIKARLRMLIAYTLANDLNYLVLGTSNQAE